MSSLLEDLAYQYGTDKSHDDHAYVNTYSMLFDSMRESVQNVTEVGLLYGKSLPVWHGYFPSATIWGLDIAPSRQAIAMGAKLGPRVRVLPPCDSQDPATPGSLGLVPHSMDILIDDGDHRPEGMAKTLVALWPLVKPGGFYVMEDVPTGEYSVSGVYVGYSGGAKSTRGGRAPSGGSGFAWVAHNASGWSRAMRQIYEQNDVFFADTLVGTRNFESVRAGASTTVRDRVQHDSHLLVIRRRHVPRTRSVQMHGWRG